MTAGASLESQIEEVAWLLQRLRATDTTWKVFGAGSESGGGHHYELAPPVSESAIRAFEDQHRVLLPDDYRLFLQRVGAAGAGPCYGLENVVGSSHPRLEEPFPFVESDPAAGADAGEVGGILELCHQGCGYYDCLVVRGAAHGTMWLDLRGIRKGFAPRRWRFLKWYRTWLVQSLDALANEPRLDRVRVGMTKREVAALFEQEPYEWSGFPGTRYFAFDDVSASFEIDADERVTKIHRQDISAQLTRE